MPASAAMPISARSLLRSGRAWIGPANVAGTASEALGGRETALSMDRRWSAVGAAKGHRVSGDYLEATRRRKLETGPHCRASSRQRKRAVSLRWRHARKPAMNVTLKPFD